MATQEDNDSLYGSFFGRNLRRIRLSKGLTQSQLAAQLGHSNNSQVAKWESSRSLPRKGTIRRVAAALSVAVAELVRHEPAPPRSAESVDEITSAVIALLDAPHGSSAAVASRQAPDALQRKAERIAHLVRALANPDALDAVERLVVEHLSKQLGLKHDVTAPGESSSHRPASRSQRSHRR